MRLVNLQLNIYLQNMCQVLCQAKRLAGLVLVSLMLFHTVAEAACTAGRAFANITETTPTSAFSHNGDSTVTHGLTGLIWDRCAVGMTLDDNSTPADFTDDTCTGTGSIYSWQDALKQVVSQNNSSHLGHSDWRLPNERELYSIVELCGADPAINQLVFPDTPAGSNERIWSATSYIGSLTGYALMVHYFVGNTGPMSKTLGNHVRLVRGGQPGNDFDLLAPTLDQTITDFTATPPNGAVGGSSTLRATASSGLTVAFGSDTPAVCTVAGSTVTYLAVGTCTVTADQAGDATYNAAPQVTLDIGVGLTDQVITNFVATPSTGVVNGSSTLSATGGASGNSVTFGSGTLAVCTVAGSTVTYVTAGTCTVTADQAGNASFNAAPTVTLDITVAKADQTITGLAANPATGIAGGTSALSATASSGLTVVTFGSSTSAVCTVAGSTVTYVTAGTWTVTADQAGNDSYNAAPTVTLDITVAKADQTITGLAANPATGVVEGSSALSATASSGLTVSFGSSTPAVCTVAGTTVSYLAAGTCTVTVDQAGDATYNAATQVTLDISVAKADQTISGLAADPASGVIGGTSTLSVSSAASVARIAQSGQKPPTTKASGIPVTFGSNTLSICTVAGSTVSYLAVGTCTVTADQAGDADYNSAPQLTLDINVIEVAPLPAPAMPIPTLSLWGLVAMFLMMLGIVGMVVRRKTRS